MLSGSMLVFSFPCRFLHHVCRLEAVRSITSRFDLSVIRDG